MKYPNPRFSPEVCSLFTLVNLATTTEGMTDLLGNALIEVEREALDRKRLQLMKSSPENCRSLREVKADIVTIISNAGGNVPEDDATIDTLQAAQRRSAAIEAAISAAEKTEQQIQWFKARFCPVVECAALLCGCVAGLGAIDPMDQFSLPWFVPLFRAADHPPDHQNAVTALNRHVVGKFHESASFSLFTRHKLMFLTFLALRTLAIEKSRLTHRARRLRCTTAGPDTSWVPADAWERAAALADEAPPIAQVLDNLCVNRASWARQAAWLAAGDFQTTALPTQTLLPLTAFRKLLLVRTFHPHCARSALR
jgi:hypothetical protein